jgi:hypothetical protein
MKKVAIIQSNYIPWKGYFDIINQVDEFILYDEVQYTRHDWRNRNKIKTPNGPLWLTIPIDVKGKFHQKILESKIADTKWSKKHWHTITTYYGKSPFFREYKELFEELYLKQEEIYLSQLNYNFIKAICEVLKIHTKISWSHDYVCSGNKTEKLVELCKITNATEYITGPAAQSYLEEELFTSENIKVTWMNYNGYPEYNQLYPPFDHAVSIIDLIFSTGNDALKYLIKNQKNEN